MDILNENTGDTPLLAAIKAKMFPQARKLLIMGAKPVIYATDKNKSRDLDDFLKAIGESDMESAMYLKNELIKLYGNRGSDN